MQRSVVYSKEWFFLAFKSTSGLFESYESGWGCYVVGVMVSRLRLALCHVPFSHTGRFLRDFDIMIRAFGLGSICIHGTTLKYTKVNRVEMGFNQSNERGGFRFLPPLSLSSSSLVVDDSTYGTWFAVAFLCSSSSL